MYWTNIAAGEASIEKAKMNGERDQLKQVYVKNREDVELGALIVDPSGEFLYFVEKMKKMFIRLSLQGIFICFLHCNEIQLKMCSKTIQASSTKAGLSSRKQQNQGHTLGVIWKV